MDLIDFVLTKTKKRKKRNKKEEYDCPNRPKPIEEHIPNRADFRIWKKLWTINQDLVPDEETKALLEAIRKDLEYLFEGHEIPVLAEVSILGYGMRTQSWHRDYPPLRKHLKPPGRDAMFYGSMIYPLDYYDPGNSCFNTPSGLRIHYPREVDKDGNITKRSYTRTMEIEVDEAFYFHADVIHAGAGHMGYMCPRLHIHVDYPGYKRKEDHVDIIETEDLNQRQVTAHVNRDFKPKKQKSK